MIIGLMLAILLMVIFKGSGNPSDYEWVDVEPWKDCPDCHGTGEIEIVYDGSGDKIRCPCAMELRDKRRK